MGELKNEECSMNECEAAELSDCDLDAVAGGAGPTLSSDVRANLLSLSKTADSVNRTNSRLSTGLNVSSPVDDAVRYFQAKGLSDRAGDITERKSGIELEGGLSGGGVISGGGVS